jgi:hypothetical protein
VVSEVEHDGNLRLLLILEDRIYYHIKFELYHQNSEWRKLLWGQVGRGNFKKRIQH